MNVNACRATKRDGHICSARLRQGEFRCGHHKPSYEALGARAYVYNEIRSKTRRMYSHLRRMPDIDPAARITLFDLINHWNRIAHRTFELMTDASIELLLNQNAGPWYIRDVPEPIDETGRVVIDLAHIQAARPAPRQRRAVQAPELQAFVNDNQNVHRAATVKMVTTTVEKVLKIEVPKPYQWNMRVMSKTPGAIIIHCKLTVPAGMAMMEKYSKADDIYEMGKGIYGRLLDSVWQFISKSDDKECLCGILRAELQDNIGMCMQGNLSRLCNVLAGYIDEIKISETPAERLGRELPKLMELEDESERLRRARVILRELALPVAEWAPWTDALLN